MIFVYGGPMAVSNAVGPFMVIILNSYLLCNDT